MSAALITLTECCVIGCTKPAKAADMCWMHYKRKQRTGRTDSGSRMRGTGTVTTHGYVAVASSGKKRQEHRIIAERAIGKQLPIGTEVHHVNGDRADNRGENLVVCPDRAYHKLLHVRQEALNACLNPRFRKCPFCKTYSDPDLMSKSKHGRHYYHAACRTKYNRSHA